MEILLNTQDYDCYNWLISTVAPQNFIKFLQQKAEVLKLLVIMHFYDFLWAYFIVANYICPVVYVYVYRYITPGGTPILGHTRDVWPEWVSFRGPKTCGWV